MTRVLSLIEGTSVTGPIKPLLDFAVRARVALSGHGPIAQSLATTRRAGGNSRGNAFIDAAQTLGVPIDVIEERHAFDPAVVRDLATLIDARQPDIVESHGFKSHAMVMLARRRRPAPAKPFAWLAFHHGYTTESTRVRVYNQVDRLTLPRADRVITVCESFARLLHQRGVHPEKTTVLRNALAPTAPAAAATIVAARLQVGLAAAEQVLLCVGRLSSEKGHASLIAAFEIVLRRTARRDLRLVLLGDGIERKRLVAQAQALGDRVVFAGHQPDARPWLGMARVFALPSLSEGSPMALLEAMQARVPIVATTAGGIPETVRHEDSALLVPPGDVPALASSLIRMVDDTALAARLAAAAHQRVQRYTPDDYGVALRALYQELAQLEQNHGHDSIRSMP